MHLKKTTLHTSAYPVEHKPLHFSHGQDERSLSRVSISSQHQTESFTCAGFMSEAPQAPTIPPSEGGVPLSPRQRRYETKRPPTTLGANTSRPKKSVCRPPAKKARVASQEESSTPPQPQPPIIESQIPSGMTPEVIIRRLMVTQPPIEENLDC